MSSQPIWLQGNETQDPGPDIAFRWGTVTDQTPLRVRVDGDAEGLPVTPDTLIDPTYMGVGRRVFLLFYGNRVVLLGRAGGWRVVP